MSGMIVIFITVALVNLVFSWSIQIWSPRDEIAHYDFIDQIGELTYPKPMDPISQYTFTLCRDRFDWIKPAKYNGKRWSMGLAGCSYESQNPPLYYALLAFPNLILKQACIDPELQIRLLRFLTTVIYLAGAALLIPLFGELSRSFHLPSMIGPQLAILVTMVNVNVYSTLGNDGLTFGLSALAILFSVRHWRAGEGFSLLLAALFVTLLVVTKLTAIPAVIGLAVLIFMSRSRYQVKLIASFVPLLVIGAYMLVNLYRFGSLLGSASARIAFASFVKPVRPDLDFVVQLAGNSIRLDHLGLSLPHWAGLAVVGAILVNFILSGIVLGRRGWKAGVLPFTCCASSLALILYATMLNRLFGGVHWHDFRHFFFAMPFWIPAIIHWPFSAAGKIPFAVPVCSALVTVAYLVCLIGRFP